MKHFHLFLFLTLLFLTPRIHAIRTKFSAPSTSSHQDFHPWANSPISSRVWFFHGSTLNKGRHSSQSLKVAFVVIVAVEYRT
ncbi:hypothetical protein CR513_60161, partial [Mucuna pruriens]